MLVIRCSLVETFGLNWPKILTILLQEGEIIVKSVRVFFTALRVFVVMAVSIVFRNNVTFPAVSRNDKIWKKKVEEVRGSDSWIFQDLLKTLTEKKHLY